MSEQNSLKVARSVIVKQFDEDTFVYINPNLPSWMRVDINGYNLINKLNGEKTVETIIEEIALEYSIDKQYIERDIDLFYNELYTHGIIEPMESKAYHKKKYDLEKVNFILNDQKGVFNEICERANNNISQSSIFSFFIKDETKGLKNLAAIIERFSEDRKVEFSIDYRLIDRPDILQFYLFGKVAVFNILVDTENFDAELLEKSLIKINNLAHKQKRIEVSISGDGIINNLRDFYRIANENNVVRVNIGHCFSCSGRISGEIVDGNINNIMEEMFDIYMSSRILLPMILRRELNHTQLNFTNMNFRNLFVTGLSYQNCGLGTKTIFIDEYGQVFPCSSLRMPEFSLGNILTDLYDDIQQRSFKYHGIACDDPLCRDCALDCFCDKGCRSDAYKNYGRLTAIDPYCEIRKKVMWKIMVDWNIIKGNNN